MELKKRAQMKTIEMFLNARFYKIRAPWNSRKHHMRLLAIGPCINGNVDMRSGKFYDIK